MNELYEEKIILNDQILENWMELSNIFENLYYINDRRFFSYVIFGVNKKCIFEY